MLNLHRLDAIECHTALEVELLAALVRERKLRLTGTKPFPHSLVPPDPSQSQAPTHPDDVIASHASVQQIQKAVCRHWRIGLNEIIAERRQATICLARHVAVILCQTLTPRSYPQLGRFKRDHTTMLNTVRKCFGLFELAAERVPRNRWWWVERPQKTVPKPVDRARLPRAALPAAHQVVA
jgi:hypothetical protein